ncbi:MAG: hypothetical protein EON58_03135 [Alphaproteobacteria bacterium]|nr:MAG: hypothetical protein EON58_03135 [Alphaproteobacteria bacterium]
MGRDISPEEFNRRFPNDVWVNEAHLRASQLAETISPRLPGESLSDAQRRIDNAFDDLHSETAHEMDVYHAGERGLFTEDFIAKGLEHLDQIRQAEALRTDDDRMQQGGLYALKGEKSHFEKRIATNPDFRAKSQWIVDRQDGRYAAVPDAISQHHDRALQRLEPAHAYEQEAAPQQQRDKIEAKIDTALEQARERARSQERER